MTDATRAFEAAIGSAPLVILTDFDFTISQVDVGDLICKELAPPSPKVRAQFNRREIGTRALWQNSMVRADRTQALRLADHVKIDPHFPAFAAWCGEKEIPLAIVSDGFGFYINHILSREGLHSIPVYCNEMVAPGQLEFGQTNPACDFCGCCKALVVKRIKERGKGVIYIGDGISDLFAAGFSTWVFAKAKLADHLRAHGSPYFTFFTYLDVHQQVQEALPDFISGRAQHKATLGPDPLCRFSQFS